MEWEGTSAGRERDGDGHEDWFENWEGRIGMGIETADGWGESGDGDELVGWKRHGVS